MSSNHSQSQQDISQDQNEDPEEQKDQIVEESPKGRFIRVEFNFKLVESHLCIQKYNNIPKILTFSTYISSSSSIQFNEELGFGAYKTVYKGYDNDSGCEIAWNVIKLQRLPQLERKRISEEISLLKNLRHKNIINFINAWMNKAKNEIIFITECLSGGSLKKYLNRIKKPRLKIIKQWCKQILSGLEYLHEQEPHPIIHRDIKCENIFVNTVNNEIRIGDLGLALTLKSDFTTSVLGTPEFMAPEIYEEKYGTGVDIYAFGMCLLEMATLQIPYKECTSAAQVYKKVSKGIHPQSLQLIQNEQLKQFVLKCIQNSENRPSATQLLQDEFFKESEIDNLPIQISNDRIPATYSGNPADSPLTPHSLQINKQYSDQSNQVQTSAFKRNSDFESPVHQVSQRQDNQSSSSASKSYHSKIQKGGSTQDSPTQSQNSSQSSDKQSQSNQTQTQLSNPKQNSHHSLSSLEKGQANTTLSDQNQTPNLQEEKEDRTLQNPNQSQEYTAEQVQQCKLNSSKQQSKDSFLSQSSHVEVNPCVQDHETNKQPQSQIDYLEPQQSLNDNDDKFENQHIQQEVKSELQKNENINLDDQTNQSLSTNIIITKCNQQEDKTQKDHQDDEDLKLNQQYYVNSNTKYSNNAVQFVTQYLPPVEKRLDDDFKMRKITEDSKEIQEDDHNNDDFTHQKGRSNYHNLSNLNKSGVESVTFSTLSVIQKSDQQEFSFNKINTEQGGASTIDEIQEHQFEKKSVGSQNHSQLQLDHNAEDPIERIKINQTYSPISLSRKSDSSIATPTINNPFYTSKIPKSDDRQRIIRQKSKSGEDFYNDKIQYEQQQDILIADNVNSQQVISPESFKQQLAQEVQSMHNLQQYGGNHDQSDQTSNQESRISLDKYSNKSQDNFAQAAATSQDSNKRVVGSNDHSEMYSNNEQLQGDDSKQQSMIEIQTDQNEDQQEVAPYSLEILKEKELKNKKFQIQFRYQHDHFIQIFEIDNSIEDFSQQSIFEFAQKKTVELDIQEYEEFFSFDLYNLVYESYNKFHSKVSSAGQRNSVQEDPASTQYSPQPVINSEHKILEIFIKHYENYMKEIEEHLKVENSQHMKIRQSKEQIQLHRFHLNQQENMIDYESLTQNQMHKSPSTNTNKVNNAGSQAQLHSQQLQAQVQNGSANTNTNQEFFDSPELISAHKKMNIQGNNYTGNDQQQTSFNNNQSSNNFKQASPSLLQSQNSNNINSIAQNYSQNNLNGSSLAQLNSNQNTQGNLNSNHLSPNSSLNTFDDNSDQQVIGNPQQLTIQKQSSAQFLPIQQPQQLSNKNQNLSPSLINNQQQTSSNVKLNTNKNLGTQPIAQQQSLQQLQPQFQQTAPYRSENNSDHKGIPHSQSLSNIQVYGTNKQQNISLHKPQLSQNISTSQLYNNSANSQQQNSQMQQVNTPSQTFQQNPSFFSQNVSQNQQQVNQTLNNNPGKQIAAKAQKYTYSSEDIQKSQIVNPQINHIKNQSNQQFKQSASSDQMNYPKSQEEQYQLQQQQQASQLYQQKTTQKQLQSSFHPQVNSMDSESIVKKSSSHNNPNNTNHPSFFIQTQQQDNSQQNQQNLQQLQQQQQQQLSQQQLFINQQKQNSNQFNQVQKNQQTLELNKRDSDSNIEIKSQKQRHSIYKPDLQLTEKDLSQYTPSQNQPFSVVSPTYSSQSQSSSKRTSDNFYSNPGSSSNQSQPQQQSTTQQNNTQQSQKVIQQAAQQIQQQQQMQEEMQLEQQKQLQLRQNPKEFSFNKTISHQSSTQSLQTPVLNQQSKINQQETNINPTQNKQQRESQIYQAQQTQQIGSSVNQQNSLVKQQYQNVLPALNQNQHTSVQQNISYQQHQQLQQQLIQQQTQQKLVSSTQVASQNSQQQQQVQQQSQNNVNSYAQLTSQPQQQQQSNQQISQFSQPTSSNQNQQNSSIPNQLNSSTSAQSLNQISNPQKSQLFRADDEIKKIIPEIKVLLSRTQIFKIERVNHHKFKDEMEIRLLQRSLKLCSPQEQILENGHFGNYTESMIKLYQKQHNIQNNGCIDNELWKSILNELQNQLAQIENKTHVQQQKDQNKKKLIKEIQSQQSKETMSNFESKMFSDFSLTNDFN